MAMLEVLGRLGQQAYGERTVWAHSGFKLTQHGGFKMAKIMLPPQVTTTRPPGPGGGGEAMTMWAAGRRGLRNAAPYIIYVSLSLSLSLYIYMYIHICTHLYVHTYISPTLSVTCLYVYL